jgi:hypothetical protein
MADEQNATQGTPEERTPEQFAAERLARYQAKPDSFIEIDELVLGVIKNPRSAMGISAFVGKCKRMELDVAAMELNHIIHKVMLNMDIEAQMKKQAADQLIKKVPAGGIMNFVKGEIPH